MSSIFMISPDYLEVCFNEIKDYDCTLQGYGSIEKGIKGLLKTNVSDILGYVYLSSALPTDLGILDEFLYRCNLYGGNKKFLIALLNTSGLNRIDFSKYPNLRFGYIAIPEVITNVTINRDIFGTILLDNFSPYKFENDVKTIPDLQNVYRLQYKPVFSSYILDCLKRVHIADSLEDTLLSDKVLYKYRMDQSILADFREHYIRTYFSDDVDNSHLFELINTETNGMTYGVYRALIDLISASHVIGRN